MFTSSLLFPPPLASGTHAFLYFEKPTLGTENGIVAPEHFVNAETGQTTPEAKQYAQELEKLSTGAFQLG